MPTSLDAVQGYPALFVVCTFSGLGVPIPEDLPLLYAGTQVASGQFDWVPALLATGCGLLIRDTLAWTIGRFVGHRLFAASWFQRAVSPDKIGRAQAMLTERGPTAVLLGRVMVGFRVPMFLAAGAAGVPLRRFVFWDFLGLVVTVPVLMGLGYAVGPSLLAMAAAATRGSAAVWGIIAFAAVAAWWWRRGRRGQAPPA